MPLWGMLVSSTYGIVALTFERFLAVVYPIWHKTKFNRNKVLTNLNYRLSCNACNCKMLLRSSHTFTLCVTV